MSRVTIKLNRTEDEHGRMVGIMDGYQAGHVLETVWDGYVKTGDTVEGTLNAVYAKFNRGSGSFIGDTEYPQRSLSVGDVVVVDDGQVFSVENIGFNEITGDDAARLKFAQAVFA